MIGYGVVGSGYFGAELARIMNTKPGAVIRAVHDPENGAAVAAELGCDAEGSLKGPGVQEGYPGRDCGNP